MYVSYEFFTDPNNYELDSNSEEPEELEILQEIGGFDLWIKLTNKELDKDIRFMHIKTGIVVEIPDWRNKLVFCA